MSESLFSASLFSWCTHCVYITDIHIYRSIVTPFQYNNIVALVHDGMTKYSQDATSQAIGQAFKLLPSLSMRLFSRMPISAARLSTSEAKRISV